MAGGIGNFLRIQAGCIEHQRKIGYAAGEHIVCVCGNAQYVPLLCLNGLGAVSRFAQLKLRNGFKRFLAIRRGLTLFQPFLVGDYLGLLFIRKLKIQLFCRNEFRKSKAFLSVPSLHRKAPSLTEYG